MVIAVMLIGEHSIAPISREEKINSKTKVSIKQL